MSHIWTFSQESSKLLDQCLKAAGPADETNKWIQQFAPQTISKNKKVDNNTIKELMNLETSIISPEDTKIIHDEDVLTSLEDVLDPGIDIISKFNYLQEKSLSNPKILTRLAQTLPINTVEALIQHVFNSKHIKAQFLNHFFQVFLPVYIKRDNSRLKTDLLLKSHKLYCEHFKLLMKVIIKDLEVQNNIINDFISMLTCSEQTDLLNYISCIEFTREEFLHNLFNIITVYKTCNKTDIIQNYILSLLKMHSELCATDKNYGKLLLAYLQHEKSLNHEVGTTELKELIEIHKSMFKRLCAAVIK